MKADTTNRSAVPLLMMLLAAGSMSCAGDGSEQEEGDEGLPPEGDSNEASVRANIFFPECTPNNPCQNGGTCSETLFGFQCACTGGYSGTVCQVPPAQPPSGQGAIYGQCRADSDCASNVCRGGICTNLCLGNEQCLPGPAGSRAQPICFSYFSLPSFCILINCSSNADCPSSVSCKNAYYPFAPAFTSCLP